MVFSFGFIVHDRRADLLLVALEPTRADTTWDFITLWMTGAVLLGEGRRERLFGTSRIPTDVRHEPLRLSLLLSFFGVVAEWKFFSLFLSFGHRIHLNYLYKQF